MFVSLQERWSVTMISTMLRWMAAQWFHVAKVNFISPVSWSGVKALRPQRLYDLCQAFRIVDSKHTYSWNTIPKFQKKSNSFAAACICANVRNFAVLYAYMADLRPCATGNRNLKRYKFISAKKWSIRGTNLSKRGA